MTTTRMLALAALAALVGLAAVPVASAAALSEDREATSMRVCVPTTSICVYKICISATSICIFCDPVHEPCPARAQ